MKLYVYDHCPYCVKARMIFGLKNIDMELVALLNDDEETPIKMIGKKMVPILEKEDGSFMPESLDIIEYIDNEFGKRILDHDIENPALSKWLNENSKLIYKLAMPRWVEADLEEFKTEGAREYFKHKKEDYIGPFIELMEDSMQMIQQINLRLRELEKIISSENSVNDKLSFDDIHLFAALRSLSIVRNIAYPSIVEEYRLNMAERSKIDLHDDIAI